MLKESRHPAAPPNRPDADLFDGRFLRRLLLALLVLASAAIVWRLADVLVLGFGSVLLALILRRLARVLSRATGLPESWAVAPVVLALAAAVVAIAWLFGAQIAGQFDVLARSLPESVATLLHEIDSRPWSAWLLGRAQDLNLIAATGQIAAGIGALFTSAIRGGAYAALMLFAGIYLAAQPTRYRVGLLRLAPADRRARLGEVLDLTGETLARWVVGQSITMMLVGALIGIGLSALGIGAPLALGLIAGIFAFVPYIGPFLAAAPGILMAAAQGPVPALDAVLVYGVVHFVEGNLVTPLIQAEVVELPPVATVFAALVFGLLLGPVGVLLAAPLTVVLLVAVNCLYIEDVLGETRLWPPLRRGHDG